MPKKIAGLSKALSCHGPGTSIRGQQDIQALHGTGKVLVKNGEMVGQ